DVEDERVTNTLKLIEKQFCIENIFFNHIGQSGFSTDLNCHLAQVYLAKKDNKFFKLLDWLVKHSSETGSWPEAIHPYSKGGSSGDGHFTRTSSEFVQIVRNMLVKEDNKILSILPFIPAKWLDKHGTLVKVEKMPTHFGVISYTLKKSYQHYVLEFDNTYHQEPVSIQIQMPKPIRSFTIDGQKQANEKASIQLPAHTKKVQFELEDSK
ncbi:MAG: hypothetical protein ACI9BD_000062, partial [Candidatus Marinamargulisbacteria bacterium]